MSLVSGKCICYHMVSCTLLGPSKANFKEVGAVGTGVVITVVESIKRGSTVYKFDQRLRRTPRRFGILRAASGMRNPGVKAKEATRQTHRGAFHHSLQHVTAYRPKV